MKHYMNANCRQIQYDLYQYLMFRKSGTIGETIIMPCIGRQRHTSKRPFAFSSYIFRFFLRRLHAGTKYLVALVAGLRLKQHVIVS